MGAHLKGFPMRLAILLSTFLISASVQAKDITVASGPFHGGSHDGDTASGTATIVKTGDGSYAMKFSDDFSATPGPDLFVYLSAATDPMQDADIKKAKFLNAGKLASPTGGQTLRLPKTFDPSKFKSVAIWCKQFSVLFGAAALK